MKATIVTIGDEILIGQVIDTNSAWLGAQLQMLGIALREIRSISDQMDCIIEAIDEGFKKTDMILMTGGLGPTKDDITKAAIAKYFGVGMSFHQPTWEKIENYFKRRELPITAAIRDQCYMPDNAQILKNNLGSAPGMLFHKGEKILVSMPGVPYEMKWIYEHQLQPVLATLAPAIAIAHRTILTVGEGESRIAERIADIEDRLDNGIKLAYLPGMGAVRLRLSGFGTDQEQIDQLVEDKKDEIIARIPELVFGSEKEVLAVKIGELLMNRNLKLGLAESCTGGHLAHLITANPGSSAYFKGSIVAYDNAVKQEVLGVKADTLSMHGAVSEQTVKEMVIGALEAVGVDVAVAVSGIAGPGGGTAEKPVGTIWIAVGNKEQQKSYKLSLSKERLLNIQYTSILALNMLRKFLLAAE